MAYKVFSGTGQLMLQGVLSSGAAQLDLSALPTGMYLLEVEGQMFRVGKVE